MPYRKVILAPEQTYHVFNRGVASLPIYFRFRDYLRFLDLVSYYRFSNTPFSFSQLMSLQKEERQAILKGLIKENVIHVEILTFCLMPNHFHLLVHQKEGTSIDSFMNSLGTRYTGYFNKKNKRVGKLFQGVYKAVLVKTEEQLLHLTRYIHNNPQSLKKVSRNIASSLPYYFGEEKSDWVDTKEILNYFYKESPRSSYKSFISTNNLSETAFKLLIDQ